MLLRFFFLVLFFSSQTPLIQAQEIDNQSRRAEKKFTEARNAYTLGNYRQAEILLEKVLKADKNFLAAYFLMATLKNESHQPLEAIAYYKKGLAINPDAVPTAYYYLAEIYFSEGMYKEALQAYQKCISYPNISPRVRDNAEFYVENCEFALEAIKNPSLFEPKNLGAQINTQYPEYFPTLTVDNQHLLFTRRLNTPYEQEDFYESKQINDSSWTESLPIDELNTAFNEGAASLSADGKTIVFTSCENYGDYGSGRKGYGSCDLFIAQKTGHQWSKAINIGSPINTAQWESQPSLSADGKSLYFIRAPKKGQGQSDIYRSDLDENGQWSKPVPLNAYINTTKNEEAVFIHPDNKTLYFSSNGHIGMGKSDLYLSRWDEEKRDWGKAINLGYPINTHKEESSILVAPNGKQAYFASDRSEGFGNLDLYSFQLPQNMQPQKITYFKGIVFDDQTKKPLQAKFELIDLDKNRQMILSESDEKEGSFLLTLLLGKNYVLNVSKSGYLFYSDQFFLEDRKTQTNPYLKNIALKPIAINEKVVLKNIFFETNKSELQTSSEIELKKLIVFLNQNPKVYIEIEGHTDSVGNSEYNQILSQARAKSVYDYIIKQHIDPKRLTYKGFGDTCPVADNKNETGRAQNRRTEIRITKI
ncbi:MAG: PD40 domain-containing protein [Bacteroidales bacterium]|nr:PD40 domain-containing protein [Bacteroidales bacterium]